MTNWWSVSRIPLRFKAVCSLSSYLSRVIYFLISLSPAPRSLGPLLPRVNLSGSHVDRRRGKVNKSLWRQLFPPSLSCLLLALSLLLCFLFVYAPWTLCSSQPATPAPPLPPSHTTTTTTCVSCFRSCLISQD